MRKNVLLNLCLMMLTMYVYGAPGVRQDIAGVCSLNFPVAPYVSDVPGLRNYSYMTDSCGYLAQVKPVAPEDLARASSSLPSFYNGVVNGILRGYHSSEIGHKLLSLDGAKGEEVEYIKGDENHKPVSVCTRMLLLGDRLVMYSFSAPYSRYAGMKNARDTFFASLSVGQTAGQATGSTSHMPGQVNGSADAQQTGPGNIHTELVRPNTLYFIVSFAASIMLLAGILYIVVKWRKKKEKS